MVLKLIDGKSSETIFEIAGDGVMPTPQSGDIFVTPDKRAFRVLQRAIVMQAVKPGGGKVVDLGAPKMLDFEVQCAACPLGEEAEYMPHAE